MYFGRRCKPGEPVVLDNPRPDKREFKSNTGNAGLDGYSVLSSADRQTGIRDGVGSNPRPFNLRKLNED